MFLNPACILQLLLQDGGKFRRLALLGGSRRCQGCPDLATQFIFTPRLLAQKVLVGCQGLSCRIFEDLRIAIHGITRQLSHQRPPGAPVGKKFPMAVY